MRQLVQSIKDGSLRVTEGPTPLIGPTEVLVETTFSMVSAGTERSVRNLASANLLSKARSRPDLVRQVISRARNNGILSTVRAVQSRLDEEMPLGYSGSGKVLAVGEAVAGIRPGMHVATGGAGHGDMQVVAGLLCAPIPDNVSDSDASLVTIASIALHGIRLADVGIGGTVCVVGLGLVGQLTVRLALASGLRVYAVDLRDWTVDVARKSGADGDVEVGQQTTERIQEWSRSRGVDAVIITAATSSSDPVRIASERLRDRGTVVVVGDIGMELRRTPLYMGEHTVKVARSYGPGRYDRTFEEWGIEYPIGYVPFSERRNLEVVLDLIASRRLIVSDLVSHEFDFTKVDEAYELLGNPGSNYLGIQIRYSEKPQLAATVAAKPAQSGTVKIGIIGAGNFTRGVLVPAIQKSQIGEIELIASASGTSASKLATRIGASACTVDQIIQDKSIDLLVIATSHSTHAELVERALGEGKHVFCEKPLAITEDELERVTRAWEQSGTHLFVGFNRRHSPDISSVRKYVDQFSTPLNISYRVNAGRVDAEHWYYDRREGGRLIGEACHFIDTCNALISSPIIEISSQHGVSGETALANDFNILIAYENGSLATISYSSHGNPFQPKEDIEIHISGHTIRIRDFCGVEVDGKLKKHRQDKGHVAQFVYLRDQLKGASSTPYSIFETSRWTIDAAHRANRPYSHRAQ